MNWKFWLGIMAGGVVGMAAAASLFIAKPDIAQRVAEGGKRILQAKRQMMQTQE
jgi:hypothetical protein